MRFKTAVALLLIVVISTTTFPLTGQEEPLPAIQPKGSLTPLTSSVVLPAEPVAVPVPLPTLEQAARANDYLTFDALYRDAVKRGDSMAAFAPLHEIWTYGVTDPIGAFYGPDIYERLVRAYPAFASYIAEYRIVDSNGNVFYPTSETRTFLLDRALEGRAPSVQLVQEQRTAPRVDLRSTTSGSVWDRVPATSRRSSTAASKRSTTSPKRSSTSSRRSLTASSGTPASSPAGTAASRRRSPKPKASKHAAAVVTKPETKAAARDTSAPLSASSAGPAGGDAGVPSKTPAPVVEKAPVVAEKTPVATDTATTVAEAPVVVRAEPTTTEPATTDTSVPAPQPIAVDNSFGGRGVLLLVIGLIGVGLLATMLRAPREVPPSIMQSPDAVPPPGDKPTGPTPVEPLRRPSAAPEPPPPGKNRAGGSHG